MKQQCSFNYFTDLVSVSILWG